MIKVIIVDDHNLVRTAITQLLSGIPGIKIIGDASDGEQAIKLVKEKRPDVVLLDIKLPGISGVRTAEKMLATNPSTKIIMLSSYMHEPLPSALLRIGVKGYLTKEASLEELVKAIRMVAEGKVYLESKVAQQTALKNIDGTNFPTDLLSSREVEVMLQILHGKDVQGIADKLCLSEKTVNTYRYRIFEKLKVKSDAELILLAFQYDILDKP